MRLCVAPADGKGDIQSKLQSKPWKLKSSASRYALELEPFTWEPVTDAVQSQAKELATERDTAQSEYADLTDQVEISLLDKEVAEERFEAAESTLESTRERLAELEVEAAVLREENGEKLRYVPPELVLTFAERGFIARMDGTTVVSADDDPSRNSLAFVQLEKQNARLKEALVRQVNL